MSTEDFKAQALRIAAEIVSEHEHSTYEQVVALVAYTYAMGSRDGFEEAGRMWRHAWADLADDLNSVRS